MKLGIVGTGMIVQFVAPHFDEWGVPVGAVCGTPSTLGEVDDLCKMTGGDAYSDFDLMLAEADIDTVYVAVPNSIHHDFARRALLAGKNAIVEKPLVSNVEEARDLAAIARSRDLLLYEAISTLYLPNYLRIRELLPQIGDVKVVSLNYSQYSSRYDAFRSGSVLPAFDPACSGGAMMDLGLYNVHYAMGLFGAPVAARYRANVEKGIDTSGVMELDYPSFKVTSVAAKDCAAPARIVIQGTKGYILQDTPANNCGPVTLHLNDGTESVCSENPEYQWESEFRAFMAGIDAHDAEGCYRMLDHSVAVSDVMTTARRAAGIRFAADDRPPAARPQ